MRANKPEDCNLLLGKMVSEGDLDAAVSLYESGAAFIAAPGTEAITDADGLRHALNGFLQLKGKLDVKVRKAVQAGDIAVLHSEWTLTDGVGPDGSAVNLGGQGVEVVRRQSDGGWKFVVDDPFASL